MCCACGVSKWCIYSTRRALWCIPIQRRRASFRAASVTCLRKAGARAYEKEAAEIACVAREVSAVQTRDFVLAMAYCAAMDEAADCRIGCTPPTPSLFSPRTSCGTCRGNDADYTDL